LLRLIKNEHYHIKTTAIAVPAVVVAKLTIATALIVIIALMWMFTYCCSERLAALRPTCRAIAGRWWRNVGLIVLMQYN
jgi:hypothetical protein